MRLIALLAFALFIGQTVAELWPLPEDWRNVPVEVEPVELEPKPEPVERVPQRSGTRWMGAA